MFCAYVYIYVIIVYVCDICDVCHVMSYYLCGIVAGSHTYVMIHVFTAISMFRVSYMYNVYICV